MKISFRFGNHTAMKPDDDQPWQASDSIQADLLNELEAAFLTLNRGRYLPYPSLEFVESIRDAWQIEDLDIVGLDLWRESVVY